MAHGHPSKNRAAQPSPWFSVKEISAHGLGWAGLGWAGLGLAQPIRTPDENFTPGSPQGFAKDEFLENII